MTRILRFTALCLGGVLLGAAAAPASASRARYLPPEETVRGVRWVSPAVEAAPAPAPAAVPPSVPAPLTEGDIDLRAGPVEVPIELRLPSLGVAVEVLGVGMTATSVMDAPVGRASDPVWQQAFWYRGSGVPGAPTTALVAAHVNDSLGRAGPFFRLRELRPGDPVVVRDLRTGSDIRFEVTEARTYSLREASDPEVLTKIYGAGPVAGTTAQPSSDGAAHLTLITCTGTFRNGTHDRRLVVSAIRMP